MGEGLRFEEAQNRQVQVRPRRLKFVRHPRESFGLWLEVSDMIRVDAREFR